MYLGIASTVRNRCFSPASIDKWYEYITIPQNAHNLNEDWERYKRKVLKDAISV
jgi:hypothetical protein